MTNKYGPRIITDGLVLCLDAADKNSYPGAGNNINNLTSNVFNIIDLNNTNMTQSNWSSDFNGTFNFDGTDEFISTDLSYTDSLESTMGVWMKAPAAPQLCGLFGVRSAFISSGIIFQNQLYITGNTGAGTAGTGVSFDDWRAIQPGFTFTTFRSVYGLNTNVCDNTWHNIIVSRSVTSTVLYIDGEIIDENSDGVINQLSPGPVYKLGAAGNTSTVNGDVTANLNGYYFNGSIGVSYFYNRGLNYTEIQRNYYALKSRYNL
jgi:hypothetical protein